MIPALLLVLTAPADLNRPAVCERLTLEARVLPALDRVEGTLTCRRAPQAPRELLVLAYADLLAVPRGVDDVNRQWHYPAGFDPGQMRIWKPSTAEPIALEAGRARVLAEESTLTLRFSTRVPHRHGPLARHEDTTWLLGGWHPVLADPDDPAGARVTEIEYRLQLPDGVVGFVGRQPLPPRHARWAEGRFVGRFLPALLAPGLRVERIPGAIVVTPTVRRLELPPGQPPIHLEDVSAHRQDAATGALVETLAHGISFLADYSVRGEVIVAVGHTGERLVERFDGGLMISDRVFHLLGFERLRKFHRIRIWRELFSELVRQRAVRFPHRLPASLVADAVAAALLERLIIDRYGGAEWAPDLLETFAVIPEIDALIFAPQVPFADAYYEAVDETPRARVRLDDFDGSLPRGKLLHEKLVDLAGKATVIDAAETYLRGTAPWLDVVSDAIGRDAANVLAPWLGPYPRLDYRLSDVSRDGDDVVVEVTANGPDADRVREPILVEVENREGDVQRARREGPGEVRVPIRGEVARAEIDPEHRLVELVHPPGEGPRFNNRRPARWRFLLNNITGLLAVTGEEVTAAADFSLRRIHDLRYRFDFFVLGSFGGRSSSWYEPSSLGVGTTASYGFGAELTPLRLSQRIGIAGAFERLGSEGGAATPGAQGSVTLFYLYDDRLNPYWSFEGKGLSVRAVGAVSHDVVGRDHQFAQAGVGAFRIFPIGFNHGLLVRLRADAQLGDAPPQNGLRLGGRYRGARGYEQTDARGKLRFLGSAEYRHVIEADARTDLLGLLTLTRVEGGLFADAVYLPDAHSRLRREPRQHTAVAPYDSTGSDVSLFAPIFVGGGPFLPCERDAYYDVGYGMRFIGDVLNVSPASIQIDLGIPIGRCREANDDLPIAVYIAFLQSFIVF